MADREIHDVLRELAADERFKEGNLALGRVPVDGVLIYEIRYSELDLDSESRVGLQEVADREGLTLNVQGGEATLRQQARRETP